MEIRPLRETESRLEVRRIYEESWKSAYRGIVPQAYLDGIPAGRSCTAISSNTKGPRETGSPGAAKGFWKNGRILQTCRANS